MLQQNLKFYVFQRNITSDKPFVSAISAESRMIYNGNRIVVTEILIRNRKGTIVYTEIRPKDSYVCDKGMCAVLES